ncbi:hypothetical protein LY76DRAFT_423670 [Colletotrichum caudatum]|nr:hypothetical protein LY76DRAFT_423670 [Colletotrichum caudatum]
MRVSRQPGTWILSRLPASFSFSVFSPPFSSYTVIPRKGTERVKNGLPHGIRLFLCLAALMLCGFLGCSFCYYRHLPVCCFSLHVAGSGPAILNLLFSPFFLLSFIFILVPPTPKKKLL